MNCPICSATTGAMIERPYCSQRCRRADRATVLVTLQPDGSMFVTVASPNPAPTRDRNP